MGVTNNWTLFGEHAHYGFNNMNVSFTDPNNSNNPLTVIAIKQDIEVVKVGINYRFGPRRPWRLHDISDARNRLRDVIRRFRRRVSAGLRPGVAPAPRFS
jgi:hypothetical protein